MLSGQIIQNKKFVLPNGTTSPTQVSLDSLRFDLSVNHICILIKFVPTIKITIDEGWKQPDAIDAAVDVYSMSHL